MPGRVSTGMAGLDALIGGGVPADSVHVLVAEPMNAPELFCYHFAAGGTKTAKSRVVVSDVPEQEVRDLVALVGGNAQNLSIATVPGDGGWVVPDPMPGERFVFAAFSSFVLAVGFEKAFQRIVELKRLARKHEQPLLVNAVGGLLSSEQLTQVKVWADGVLEIGLDRQGFGLYPYLKVTKLRGVPDSTKLLLFKETDKGLLMESTRRVF